MASFRTIVLSIGAAVLGILTIRTIRRRRMSAKEEAEVAVDDAKTEATEAIDHAAAAVGHARRAGEKAVEHVRDEQFKSAAEEGKAGTKNGQRKVRIRQAGKNLVRR